MPQQGMYTKALVLIIVFSLNTVVSFACSLSGLFHSLHHHTNSSTPAKQHSHHQHNEGHHHNHETASHYPKEQAPEKPADDCCSRNVVELEKAEKAPSRVIEAPDTAFLTSFLIVCSSIFSKLPAEGKTIYPQQVRWRIPATIQDLRIVIQSFQI